eukprot:6325697-Prymnesium_polylepis.1
MACPQPHARTASSGGRLARSHAQKYSSVTKTNPSSDADYEPSDMIRAVRSMRVPRLTILQEGCAKFDPKQPTEHTFMGAPAIILKYFLHRLSLHHELALDDCRVWCGDIDNIVAALGCVVGDGYTHGWLHCGSRPVCAGQPSETTE